jgi:hypothetical protein
VKRFILIMSQKSAEGVLLQKIGGRPERKGAASNRTISEATSGRKANLVGLPDARRSEAPRGVYEGTESFSGDAQYRKPGYSQVAQPAEPPYADPHVRWERRE